MLIDYTRAPDAFKWGAGLQENTNSVFLLQNSKVTCQSPFHTARWSRKIARNLPECLLCERKHVPGLIPGLIPGWGPSVCF